MQLLNVLLVFSALFSGALMQATNTGTFTLFARNASYPDVDGRRIIIHYSGLVYVSAGAADPRLSYPLVASVQDRQLIRDATGQSQGSPGRIGNLNFGTSGVCCNYAALNFSAPGAIPYPARTTPFFVDAVGGGAGELVFEEEPYRSPWYACQKGGWKQIYYNIPFYEYPGTGGQQECTIVRLQTAPPSATTGTSVPTWPATAGVEARETGV